MNDQPKPVDQPVSPVPSITPGTQKQRRPRVNGLTLQQQLFANEYVKAKGNGTKAIKAVRPHLTDASARATASNILANNNVLQEVYRQAAAANLTIPRVMGSISQALDATKPLQSMTGEIISQEPDHTIRLRAADQACKLLRLYSQGSDGSQGHGSRHLHLHVDDESGRDVLEGLADRQARRQRKAGKLPNDLTIDVQVVSSEATGEADNE